ncbi:amino-acid N-acetyltransferase [Granulicoccus sp. GXG6511]|uniref:amino-acid N-acetyltransferase n=1 Tax=Granulicoccus sp. GXG6511 TaxID=3381351 RepID=UPI003D7D78CF
MSTDGSPEIADAPEIWGRTGDTTSGEGFVSALRSAGPYIHGHHGRTFVIALPGENCARDDSDRLLGDIALLVRLGVKIVLVHGARPQIEAELALRGIQPRFADDLRITDAPTMKAVRAAIGVLRMDIEARLAASVETGSPMTRVPLKVVGGTWVTAQPVGVRNGIDHQLTGRVRKVDIAEIRHALQGDRIVLLSPVGYSPTGETFNVRNAEVAQAVATGLGADKLIFVMESEPGGWRLVMGAGDAGQVQLSAAEETLAADDRQAGLSPEDRNCIAAGLTAARNGVRRVHFIGTEGASPLLRELYTRDGCGLMVSADDDYESTRDARIDDVQGILTLIRPLEEAGLLRQRSREQIEVDIDQFAVMVRDGMVIACYALIEFAEDLAAEFSCVAVHPDYQGRGLAAVMLRHARRAAKEKGMDRLFVLTTQTPGWFLEHGFTLGTVADLPAPKRADYNPARNSLVLTHPL